jgi:hypothetical protein
VLRLTVSEKSTNQIPFKQVRSESQIEKKRGMHRELVDRVAQNGRQSLLRDISLGMKLKPAPKPTLRESLLKEISKGVQLKHVPEPVPVQQPVVGIPVPPPQPPKVANKFLESLKTLEDCGFTDQQLNINLLVQNKGDIHKTIVALLAQ